MSCCQHCFGSGFRHFSESGSRLLLNPYTIRIQVIIYDKIKKNLNWKTSNMSSQSPTKDVQEPGEALALFSERSLNIKFLNFFQLANFGCSWSGSQSGSGATYLINLDLKLLLSLMLSHLLTIRFVKLFFLFSRFPRLFCIFFVQDLLLSDLPYLLVILTFVCLRQFYCQSYRTYLIGWTCEILYIHRTVHGTKNLWRIIWIFLRDVDNCNALLPRHACYLHKVWIPWIVEALSHKKTDFLIVDSVADPGC